jgi:hypothetical protein
MVDRLGRVASAAGLKSRADLRIKSCSASRTALLPLVLPFVNTPGASSSRACSLWMCCNRDHILGLCESMGSGDARDVRWEDAVLRWIDGDGGSTKRACAISWSSLRSGVEVALRFKLGFGLLVCSGMLGSSSGSGGDERGDDERESANAGLDNMSGDDCELACGLEAATLYTSKDVGIGSSKSGTGGVRVRTVADTNVLFCTRGLGASSSRSSMSI